MKDYQKPEIEYINLTTEPIADTAEGETDVTSAFVPRG